MNCLYCQTGKISVQPTCRGVEIGCRECGHSYTPEEFRELMARRERAAVSPPSRPEGDPA